MVTLGQILLGATIYLQVNQKVIRLVFFKNSFKFSLLSNIKLYKLMDKGIKKIQVELE